MPQKTYKVRRSKIYAPLESLAVRLAVLRLCRVNFLIGGDEQVAAAFAQSCTRHLAVVLVPSTYVPFLIVYTLTHFTYTPSPAVNEFLRPEYRTVSTLTMAETFAIAAGVIAVIQITDRVLDICRFYIESVQDCPLELRVILSETFMLKILFE